MIPFPSMSSLGNRRWNVIVGEVQVPKVVCAKLAGEEERKGVGGGEKK
ncbi:hypothetical protein AAZX31_13G055400 [Glycine max]